MNIQAFGESVSAQLARSADLLCSKGCEYAEGADSDNGIDRLAHFKKAAALQGMTAEQAAFGMLAKHLVSVSDMVAANEHYSPERWNEKITDSINYLLIIRAIIEEKESTYAQDRNANP